MSASRANLTASSSEFIENVKKGKDKIIQVYEMLPNYCLEEEIPELLDGLRDAMKSYVILDTKFSDLKTTKQKVIQEITRAAASDKEKDVPTLDEINEELKKTLSKESEKHVDGYWERDALYASMKDFAADGQEEQEEAMDDGDGLAVTGQSIQTIDPYSKKEFVNPVKNVNCNHPYEKDTIMELIKVSASRDHRGPRCYHMGCNVRVKAQDLVPDEDLKRHLARIRARAM